MEDTWRKDFEPGYCRACGGYKTEVVLSGFLLASSNLDPINFVDFIIKGNSISRLTIRLTESSKEFVRKSNMRDLMTRAAKFCKGLDVGDCLDCGMPIVVPWEEK